ncbi:MAG: hypothetical protein KBT09_07820 [Bacteroidales bacterium]|nr:hypothetical protein [Candidatus Sodaliphilus fimicaballi]
MCLEEERQRDVVDGQDDVDPLRGSCLYCIAYPMLMCIFNAHGMGFRIEQALRAADIFDVIKQAPSDCFCHNIFVVNKF